MRARPLLLACCVAVAGCGGSGAGGGPGGSGGDATDRGPEAAFFAGLPSGATQLARVCARGSHDAVTARQSFSTAGVSSSPAVQPSAEALQSCRKRTR